MSLARRLPEVLVPALLVLATALLGLAVSSYLQAYFVDTLIKVAIVVGLYVFIGNSGVLSFGQISFVAVGAWTAGVLTVPKEQKLDRHAGPRPFPRHHNVGNIASLALAAAVGGTFALAVGLPLMRLSGLAAGIATFAVLEITNNVLNYETNDRPGPEQLLVGSRDDRDLAGRDRRPHLHRRGLCLPAHPLRPDAACDA